MLHVILVRNNYFGHTELYIWDIIICGFQENRDDMLRDLVRADVRHDSSQWIEAAYPIVVSFFVYIIAAAHNWDVIIDDPTFAEFFGQDARLRDSHFPDTCSRVGQISHKDTL